MITKIPPPERSRVSRFHLELTHLANEEVNLEKFIEKNIIFMSGIRPGTAKSVIIRGTVLGFFPIVEKFKIFMN